MMQFVQDLLQMIEKFTFCKKSIPYGFMVRNLSCRCWGCVCNMLSKHSNVAKWCSWCCCVVADVKTFAATVADAAPIPQLARLYLAWYVKWRVKIILRVTSNLLEICLWISMLHVLPHLYQSWTASSITASWTQLRRMSGFWLWKGFKIKWLKLGWKEA